MTKLAEVSHEKTLRLVLIALGLLAVPMAAHGQVNGCTDSPENPTVVLALVGSAGAFLASARRRLAIRRSNLK